MIRQRSMARRTFARMLDLRRLEDRITPAITTTWDPVFGALSVSSDGNDPIVLSSNSDRRVTVNGSAAGSSPGITIESRLVHSITVSGGPGNNVIDLSGVDPLSFSEMAEDPSARTFTPRAGGTFGTLTAMCVQIDGGAGNDIITGSQYGDIIDSFLGADQIDGGFGDDVIWIRNDDFSPVTVYGGPGDNTLIVDYARQVGTTQAVTVDIANGSSTIAYGLKQCVEKDTTVRLADQDYNQLTVINSSPLPGGGGTVDISSRSVSDTQVLISTDILKKKFSWAAKLEGGKEGLATSFLASVNGMEIRIDACEAPFSIDNAGGGNSLVVNTFGLPSSVTTAGVQVAGMAPITFTGISAVSTEVRLYDEVALADLKALGVIILPTVSVGPDGMELLSLSVTNNSPVFGLKTEWITSIGLPKITPKISKESHGRVLPPGRIIGVTPGAAVDVEFHDTRADIPVANLAAGMEWAQEVGFTMTALAPGQSVTNSIKLGHYTVSNFSTQVNVEVNGREYHVDISSYFETGDIPTESQFASVLDSVLGVTPSGGPTLLIGSDASGQIALVSSSASGIDHSITTSTAGTHLYAGQQMVDVALDGHSSGNAPATVAEMDLTGRFVVFESEATNLVAGLIDNNGATDVFLRDMLLGKTYCLSSITLAGGSMTGNGASFDPQISGDGQCIVFRTSATNIASGVIDNNNEPDLMFFDLNPANVGNPGFNDAVCISLVPNLVPSQTCDHGVIAVDMNGDAFSDYTVAYLTDATNGGGSGGGGGGGGGTLYVKKHLGNVKYNEFSVKMATHNNGLTVSLDGSTVILWTDADVSSLLGPGVIDGNGVRDILSINASTGAVTPVSINYLGTAMANGPSPAYAGESPAVSVDGSHIAFTSYSSNLISGLAIPATDGLYLAVKQLGSITPLERIDTMGATSFGSNNHDPSISADGTTIAWSSTSDYKSSGPAFTKIQTWVKDCYDGKDLRKSSVLVSVTPSDGSSDGASYRAIMARTGEYVAFASDATNIVAGDTNGQTDVFTSAVHDTYRFQLSATDPADVTLQYDALTDSVQIVNTSNGAVVTQLKASDGKKHFEVTAKWQSTSLRTITINMGSGLQRLGGDIVIHGDTGNERVVVTGLTSLAAVDMSGGAGGASSLTASRLRLQGTFSDGSTRDITESVMSVQCTDVEELDNAMQADRVNVHEFSHTVQVTAQSSGTVRHTEFEGGGTGLKDLAASPNTQFTLYLTSGSDSCTMDLSDLAAGKSANIKVIGNGGSDTVTQAGAPINNQNQGIWVDTYSDTDGFVTGTAGQDTITIGPVGGTFAGGAGNDVYLVRCFPAYQPHPQACNDLSGNDRIDFSENGYGVTFNMDSQATQAYMPAQQITVTGILEDAIGSPFDDVLTVRALSVPRSLDGGSQVSGTGDMLIVDAEGKAATIVGNQVLVQGKAPINFTNFEHVSIINNAPTLQVVSVVFGDGTNQRSIVKQIVVYFSAAADFMGGVASAFTLHRNGTGGSIGDVVLTANPVSGPTSSVTLTFSGSLTQFGSLIDGKYDLTISAAQVSSSSGALDGNYDNIPGGSYSVIGTTTNKFFRFFGDSDGSGSVDQAIDFVAFKNAFGFGSTMFDFNSNGTVDQSADFLKFKNNFGLTP